ncbi:hypothetical protein [Brevibacillus fortis]|nr:hypothetical protein [Brevibacillus fortis]
MKRIVHGPWNCCLRLFVSSDAASAHALAADTGLSSPEKSSTRKLLL